jgi:hypothetical protein
MIKSALQMLGGLALVCMAGAAQAQGTGDVIKIGILNDQSGPYADVGGKGSVVAAKLAVEDFGSKLLGKRIEIVAADHQTAPVLQPAWLFRRSRATKAECSLLAPQHRRTSLGSPARLPDFTLHTIPMPWRTGRRRRW